MSGGQESRLWGLIPAAGSGVRMQSKRPKQYLKLLDHCLLEHAVSALADVSQVSGVMVVVAEGDPFWAELMFTGKAIYTAAGGPTRAHSVLNGLQALQEIAAETDWVLVHDAVRPCVRAEDIQRLITAVGADPNGGLLALPINDTVKREQDQRSCDTVSRDRLWRAQTPQLFRIVDLFKALQTALAGDMPITDEANAMERLGFKPLLVQGSESNIKVTYPDDLVLAESYLNAKY